MATMADSPRLLLDTNILLTATAPARRLHPQAMTLLLEGGGRGWRLCTSSQILREYLAVATRPMEANGLALTAAEGLHNATRLSQRMELLEEGEETFRQLARILGSRECLGKQVHDAHIVATAQAHGVGAIVTENLRDFRRFTSLLQIIDLAALEASFPPTTE